MTLEAQFSGWLMKNVLHRAHAQRIESTTGSGIPDINVCALGHEFWIETKIVSAGSFPLLRPYQLAWISRRIADAGLVLVVAYDDIQDVVRIWSAENMVTRFRVKYHEIVSPPREWCRKNSLKLEDLIAAL